jgi:hypothetical protein
MLRSLQYLRISSNWNELHQSLNTKQGIMTHLDEIAQDHIPMRLKDSESDEQDELIAVVIGPKDFPQPKNIVEGELALERDEHPAGGAVSLRREVDTGHARLPEAEEEVKAIVFF